MKVRRFRRQSPSRIRPGFDASNNEFEAYTSYFRWEAGLCVRDWRYFVRICNIDVTSAGLAGASAPDLFALLSKAVVRLPTLNKRASAITKTDAPSETSPGIRPAIYCNRIDVQFGAKADRAFNTADSGVLYANKRAEMWGAMKDWLVGGSIPDDDELVRELIAVEYGFATKDGRDAVLLEAKKDRLGAAVAHAIPPLPDLVAARCRV